MENWFTIDRVDKDTYIISEYNHWEETHCYLLNGSEKSLLIDTGLGIGNIFDEVSKLTDNEVIVIATHVHWDHIGGHKYFSEFYVHENELSWLNGSFPLPLNLIKKIVSDCSNLPENWKLDDYDLFQGKPTKVVKDNDIIDIGGRSIQIYHTPGHSPGHMCLWEKARGYLFTGDLVYKGDLFAHYPSTNPKAYLTSLEKISTLPVKKILPGHHTLDIQPEILGRMLKALRKLEKENKLKHGSGKFDYGDWAILL